MLTKAAQMLIGVSLCTDACAEVHSDPRLRSPIDLRRPVQRWTAKQLTSELSSQASRRPSTATASARAAANSAGNADPRELSQLPPPSYESALTYNGAFELPRLRQRHLRPKSRTAETQTDIPLETALTQTAVSGASRPYHSTLRPIVGFHESRAQ